MNKISIAFAAGLLVAAVTPAFAVDEPLNVIKYRQNVMKSIGAHTGAIAGVVKGEVSFAGDVEAHARSINAMSMLLGHLFPKGTDNAAFQETRALPAIWEEMGKFDAAMKGLQQESAKLIDVAQGGDMAAIGAQLENLGKACGGCHKPYRAEKQ